MDELPIVEILLADLERIRDVVTGCVTYFTAEDVQRAQLAYREIRKSAMTRALEEAKERMDGILADYLFEQYQEAKEEGTEDIIVLGDDEDEDEDEEPAAEESELSGNPLGSPKFSSRIVESQVGRR